MNRGGLRWRLVIWVCVSFTVTLVLFGTCTAYLLWRMLLKDTDTLLHSETDYFFHEISEMPVPIDWNGSEAMEEINEVQTGGEVLLIEDNGKTVFEKIPIPEEVRARNKVYYNFKTQEGQYWRLQKSRRGTITVFLGSSLDRPRQVITNLILAYLGLLPLILLATIAVSLLAVQFGLKPLRKVIETMENTGINRLDTRMPEAETEDETGRLITVFNGMLRRLQASFAQATRFTTDASHELKTPLSIMRNDLEILLKSDSNTPEQEEKLISILDETERMVRMTEILLQLSSIDGGRLKPQIQEVDLHALLDEAVADTRDLGEAQNLEVRASIAEPLKINADPILVRQVVLNLIDNAVKYNQPEGFVSIYAAEKEDKVKVRVGNSGTRIAVEDTERIFDRFYRTDSSRQRSTGGLGLGLSLCRELLKLQNASISISQNEDHFVEFEITLPSSKAQRTTS